MKKIPQKLLKSKYRKELWENSEKIIKKLEKTFPVNSNLEISNQLVNKIIEKEKKIDELNLINNLLYDNTIQKIKGKITMVDDNIYKQSINNEIENKSMNLILNNQIIHMSFLFPFLLCYSFTNYFLRSINCFL